MSAESKLFTRNHFAIALMAMAAALLMMPIHIFAQGSAHRQTSGGREDPKVFKGFVPRRVFLSNDNVELSSTTEITVASLTYKSSKEHRLTIDYSSVGAIEADNAADPAILFIGCFVDGNPCVGSQNDPSNTPAGWVNALSCDYPNSAAWDNHVGYVWFTDALQEGSHTVVIKAAVGNPLIPFLGTGTLFNEARNLIVTLLSRSEEDED